MKFEALNMILCAERRFVIPINPGMDVSTFLFLELNIKIASIK